MNDRAPGAPGLSFRDYGTQVISIRGRSESQHHNKQLSSTAHRLALGQAFPGNTTAAPHPPILPAQPFGSRIPPGPQFVSPNGSQRPFTPRALPGYIFTATPQLRQPDAQKMRHLHQEEAELLSKLEELNKSTVKTVTRKEPEVITLDDDDDDGQDEQSLKTPLPSTPPLVVPAPTRRAEGSKTAHCQIQQDVRYVTPGGSVIHVVSKRDRKQDSSLSAWSVADGDSSSNSTAPIEGGGINECAASAGKARGHGARKDTERVGESGGGGRGMSVAERGAEASSIAGDAASSVRQSNSEHHPDAPLPKPTSTAGEFRPPDGRIEMAGEIGARIVGQCVDETLDQTVVRNDDKVDGQKASSSSSRKQDKAVAVREEEEIAERSRPNKDSQPVIDPTFRSVLSSSSSSSSPSAELRAPPAGGGESRVAKAPNTKKTARKSMYRATLVTPSPVVTSSSAVKLQSVTSSILSSSVSSSPSVVTSPSVLTPTPLTFVSDQTRVLAPSSSLAKAKSISTQKALKTSSSSSIEANPTSVISSVSTPTTSSKFPDSSVSGNSITGATSTPVITFSASSTVVSSTPTSGHSTPTTSHGSSVAASASDPLATTTPVACNSHTSTVPKSSNASPVNTPTSSAHKRLISENTKLASAALSSPTAPIVSKLSNSSKTNLETNSTHEVSTSTLISTSPVTFTKPTSSSTTKPSENSASPQIDLQFRTLGDRRAFISANKKMAAIVYAADSRRPPSTLSADSGKDVEILEELASPATSPPKLDPPAEGDSDECPICCWDIPRLTDPLVAMIHHKASLHDDIPSGAAESSPTCPAQCRRCRLFFRDSFIRNLHESKACNTPAEEPCAGCLALSGEKSTDSKVIHHKAAIHGIIPAGKEAPSSPGESQCRFCKLWFDDWIKDKFHSEKCRASPESEMSSSPSSSRAPSKVRTESLAKRTDKDSKRRGVDEDRMESKNQTQSFTKIRDRPIEKRKQAGKERVSSSKRFKK